MAKLKELSFAKSLIFTISLLLGLSACQKKSDNSAAVPPTPYIDAYINCPTCFANTSTLLNAVQVSTGLGSVTGQFDIVAQPAAGFDLADPKAIFYYIGPVQLIGAMNINIAGDRSLCWAIPGQYMIRPLENGIMEKGAIFKGMRIVAEAGTATFTGYIIRGQVTNAASGIGPYRGSNTNRLGMTLLIDSVNGQACPLPNMPIEFF